MQACCCRTVLADMNSLETRVAPAALHVCYCTLFHGSQVRHEQESVWQRTRAADTLENHPRHQHLAGESSYPASTSMFCSVPFSPTSKTAQAIFTELITQGSSLLPAFQSEAGTHARSLVHFSVQFAHTTIYLPALSVHSSAGLCSLASFAIGTRTTRRLVISHPHHSVPHLS